MNKYGHERLVYDKFIPNKYLFVLLPRKCNDSQWMETVEKLVSVLVSRTVYVGPTQNKLQCLCLL